MYSLSLARVYVGLGEKDQAFAWLEKAYEERSTGFYLLKVDPMWDPLRSDADAREAQGAHTLLSKSASRAACGFWPSKQPWLVCSWGRLARKQESARAAAEKLVLPINLPTFHLIRDATRSWLWKTSCKTRDDTKA